MCLVRVRRRVCTSTRTSGGARAGSIEGQISLGLSRHLMQMSCVFKRSMRKECCHLCGQTCAKACAGYQRRREKFDGCAIFFNSKRLELLGGFGIDFAPSGLSSAQWVWLQPSKRAGAFLAWEMYTVSTLRGALSSYQFKIIAALARSSTGERWMCGMWRLQSHPDSALYHHQGGQCALKC